MILQELRTKIGLLIFSILLSIFHASTLTADYQPNKIILIVVDTLRADHLPFYGYQKNTAPFLSSLMPKTVLFEKALSTSSYTAPATASIHTGLYPYEHGVLYGMNATKRLSKVHSDIKLNRIPESVVTLAEYFQELNYTGYAVTDNGNICTEMGFAQGFKNFKNFRNKGAKFVNEQVLEWSSKIKKQSKYFLYLHYMDPHSPYLKHDQWYDKSAKGTQGRVIASYNSEINYVDQKIKDLFVEFGWDKDTLIIFTSDHGEEFWEHGKLGHGKTLYKEVIHVPLFFYFSDLDLSPGSVPNTVSVIDILPTLQDLLGTNPKNKQLDYRITGASLFPYFTNKRLSEKSDRHLVSNLRKESKTGKLQSIDSLSSSHWKVIVSKNATNKSKEPVVKKELYQIQKDPLEKHNLLKTNQKRALELEQHLDKKIRQKAIIQPEYSQYDFKKAS